jgi:hypothetical protein
MTEICDTPNLLDTNLPSSPPMERSGSLMPATLMNIDYTRYDAVFTISAITWMRGRTGDGEEGIISRNDALCTIFQYLAGMDKYSRNKHDDSTMFTTRSDRTDKYGGITLVMTEEKDYNLAEAQEDLRRKFRWLPHFSQLPFIFGIAITHDQLAVHTMHFTAPTTRQVFLADLSSFIDRWRCVVAAVNIARTIQGFVAARVLIPCALRFDVWHQRNAKKIRLGMSYVEVQFETDQQYMRMRQFYQRTAGVPYLEHMITGDACNDAYRRIKLGPVGVNRLPLTLPELVKCVKDICTALFRIHGCRAMHCDVRWSNIIEYFGAWYLIDCEYACLFDDDGEVLAARSREMRQSHVMDSTIGWTPRHDLYQVGLLLQDVDALTSIHVDLVELRNTLLTKGFEIDLVKSLVIRL